MGWRGLAIAACLAALPAAPGHAQSDPGIRAGLNAGRPFAEPLFWLNAGPADRLPIRARPLTRQLGFAGLAPPALARQGFTPFVGLSYSLREGQDQTTASESFAALGIGASYVHLGRRQQLEATYFAEVTGADGTGGGIDNQGGALNYNLTLSDRDRLGLFATYSTTTDLQTAPLTGTIANAAEFETASLTLTYARDLGARSGVELGLSGLSQTTDQGGADTARSLGLDARFFHFAAPDLRWEANLALFDYEIAGLDFQAQQVDIGLTRDLGPRLAVSGLAGLIHTDANGGDTFARLGARLVMSGRNARLALALERDLIAVPGLTAPALTDRISAEWQVRLGHGWLGALTLEARQLDDLSPGGAGTRAYGLDGQMSYAIDRRLWVWGRLSLTEEESAGARTRDTRLTVGLSRNLD